MSVGLRETSYTSNVFRDQSWTPEDGGSLEMLRPQTQVGRDAWLLGDENFPHDSWSYMRSSPTSESRYSYANTTTDHNQLQEQDLISTTENFFPPSSRSFSHGFPVAPQGSGHIQQSYLLQFPGNQDGARSQSLEGFQRIQGYPGAEIASSSRDRYGAGMDD
jgi:hypothetical protein